MGSSPAEPAEAPYPRPVSAPEVLERVETDRGELVLRLVDGHVEVVSNGVFLMDTRDGRSERLLARAALAAHPDPRRVLVGGLGVGFSLAAVGSDERVRSITVVEIEPALLDWHRTHLRPYSAGALDDPRVDVVVADLADVLTGDERWDVVCVDVDNGPDWTVTPANTALYDDEGVRRMLGRLSPGGVLAVWSSHPVPSYEQRLRRQAASVEVLAVEVPRGEPDVVYVARRAP